MGATREDQAASSLITTIPTLLELFDVKRRQLYTSSQDPFDFNSDYTRVRSYRVLGRVKSYDAKSGILIVQDFNGIDGDELARPVYSEITVTTDLLVGEGEGLPFNCASRGEWIHVIGRPHIRNEQLALTALVVWHCESLVALSARRLLWEITQSRLADLRANK